MGLTEPEARAKYGDDAVKIYRSSFRALYFSMVPEEHKEPSVYKLVCVGPEERVVGIHIIGMGSDEVMQGFGVAVKMGATKEDLDNTVAIHPTSAEGECRWPFLPACLSRCVWLIGLVQSWSRCGEGCARSICHLSGAVRCRHATTDVSHSSSNFVY